MDTDNNNQTTKGMRLLEVLTRTRFQVFTFPQGTLSDTAIPEGAGSGFVLEYNGKLFFVTADHVCHPDDYKPGVTQRSFDDKDVAIVNNWIEKDPKTGKDTHILTPIGGLYYFTQLKFDLNAGFGDIKPFDATFAVFNLSKVLKPLKNEPLYVAGGSDVPGGLDMIPVPSHTIITPNADDRYIVYGHTQFTFNTTTSLLEWKVTHHENMTYLCENGDYYVLKPNEPVKDKEWKGISGAPVFNLQGGLLGILCGGNETYSVVFVMKIQKLLSFIDTTMKIEGMGGTI